MTQNRDIDQVLSAIERLEQRSLQWGYASGALQRDELLDLIQQVLGPGAKPSHVAEELLDRVLLVRFPGPGDEDVYRSRFAEGVRLLTELKQLTSWQPDWRSAPNLVSDFRVDVRPRRYPKRDQSGANVLARLTHLFGWDEKLQQIASDLLRRGGNLLELSAFQARAVEHILAPPTRDKGVVISAGTGSGKTLAYYFPAIALITERLAVSDYWTKSISVYPRSELLKDQFSEAYSMAHAVVSSGARPVRLGTFFSGTPNQPTADAVKATPGWEETALPSGGTGYTCPFLVCPRCGGKLVWRGRDLAARVERLNCVSEGCGFRSEEGEIALTRSGLQANPPDLLFTTVETLNQRMSDSYSRHVFGVGRNRERRPLLMLLDEVHTYEGSSGAQSALVVRRWRHAVASPIRWVGLSATLRDATRFFSQLSGVPEAAVVEVTPREEEYESDAGEYNVVLRGDPVSQTALLSTSIQAAFLLARLLDPPGQSRSSERYGKRAFVFTDDLDVTNRLYDDLSDAEEPEPPRRPPLAALRAQGDDRARMAAGQDWSAIERIGWDLHEPLRISRTSSQDAGVSTTSQVVVSTSALEVGFNDNTVGAVLQHKSPYRMSQFVQRKGRAGRIRKMRPWMVTVLSDYGRDRVTYQTYEALFDPVLPPQRLPTENQYIRRIQAAFAFIDWLAIERPGLDGWWWWSLNGPPERTPANRERVEEQQKELRAILKELLAGSDLLLRSLRQHLSRALALTPDEVEEVLWEPPRSLMLELLPTLRRRLATGWRMAAPLDNHEFDLVYTAGPPHPLPEFLPANLFSELNLPEVAIGIPGEERTDSMMIGQALRHLAPGRVTRRFAHRSRGVHHWIPVPVDLGSQPYRLPVDRYASDYRLVTETEVELDGERTFIPIYRPWRLNLAEVLTPQTPPWRRRRLPSGPSVLPSSNARMDWMTQIVPTGEPFIRRPEHDPTWRQLIEEIGFHMHSVRAPVTVRRFAMRATANIRPSQPARRRHEDGETEEVIVHTTFARPSDESGAAAVGFEAEVDALCIRFRVPPAAQLAHRVESATSLPAWRAAYFRDRIRTDNVLPLSANVFLRDWLHQIYLSTLVALAVEQDLDLLGAIAVLRGAGAAERFQTVMDTMFKMQPVGEFEDDDQEPDAGARLRWRLDALLRNPDVVDQLGILAGEVVSPDPHLWALWLAERVHETLGGAVRYAALSLAPRHIAEDSILLDLDRGIPGEGLSEGRAEVWLTESTVGGAGVVEALADVYAEEPRRFFRALEAALAADGELISVGLSDLIRLASNDGDVADAMAETRAQRGHESRDRALRRLCALLAGRGVVLDHQLSVALNQRVLRDGTDAGSDGLLHELNEYWDHLEERLGVSISLRIFCYIAAQSPRFGPRVLALIRSNTGTSPTLAESVGVLSGILWQRPSEARARILDSWTPYREQGFTDPRLIGELVLQNDAVLIGFRSLGWLEQVKDNLSRFGSTTISAEQSAQQDVQIELLQLIAEPVDVGYLQFYPAIERIRREGGQLLVNLVLREFV